MGRFDADYLARFPIAVIRIRGEIVAFSNLWCAEGREEFSPDLMRYSALGDTVAFASPATLFSGGGGLVSTARDYGRFAQMVINGGVLNDTRILGRKTVEFMRRDHLGDVAGPGAGNGFGLGFAVKESVNALPTSVGTFYWGGLHGTSFWIDPEENLIGIFMIQIYPNRSTNFGQQFQQLVYSALVG